MIQAMVKLRFVKRYCSPAEGWHVFVDIDPSEEGRTGTPRLSEESRDRLERMLEEAPQAVRGLIELGACVGKRKRAWQHCFGRTLELPKGDRDIIAVHPDKRRLLIAEVEGDSGGQPEGKIYKALGQLVVAAGEPSPTGYRRQLILVVWGNRAEWHLLRASASARIGIAGLVIGDCEEQDRWLFRPELGQGEAAVEQRD
jgi:hypothetical protein